MMIRWWAPGLVVLLSLTLVYCSGSDSGSTGSDGFLGNPAAPVASGCPDSTHPCCNTPATAESLNDCFTSVTDDNIQAGFSPSQVGVLVHGWDGTEVASKPWAPGDQQGGGTRWSSSYINLYNVSKGPPKEGSVEEINAPPTISLYSIFSGGIVLSIPDTTVTCAFAQDAGTDARPMNPDFPGGCGPSTDGQGGWCADCQFLDAANSCDYSEILGSSTKAQCTIPTPRLSAMLAAQRTFTELASGWRRLEMAYNEVVVEPLDADSKTTLAAFYNPVETDPRARACGSYNERPEFANGVHSCCPVDPYTREENEEPCTVNSDPKQLITCDEMEALYAAVPEAQVPLLTFDPTNLDTPFTLACTNWTDCSGDGKPCGTDSE